MEESWERTLGLGDGDLGYILVYISLAVSL